MLELNLNEILAAIFNFVLLVVLLRLFLYKPVLRMLDQRQAVVDESLKNAAALKRQLSGAEEEISAMLAAAKKEAEEIVSAGRLAGEQTREEIIAEARAEVAALTLAAEEALAREKELAIAELNKQVAQLTIMATQKVIQQELTLAQHQLINDKYIAEIGEIHDK